MDNGHGPEDPRFPLWATLLAELLYGHLGPARAPAHPDARPPAARPPGPPPLLDDCAREIRGLVALAADPEASHDARLAAACRRVRIAVEALTEGAPNRPTRTEHPPPATEPALAHLHSLEHALAQLVHPLRTPSGSPLLGA